jgi:predicted SprT family Zn-dependent metalloprotease
MHDLHSPKQDLKKIISQVIVSPHQQQSYVQINSSDLTTLIAQSCGCKEHVTIIRKMNSLNWINGNL